LARRRRSDEDFNEHWRAANNKAKRVLWALVYIAKGFRTELRFTGREQPGSRVVYDGRVCYVSNWAGSEHPTLADDRGWYQENCDRSKIVNRRALGEWWHRFTVGLSWYMSSWYTIDVQRRLYGW
jgi:hypothetical protein